MSPAKFVLISALIFYSLSFSKDNGSISFVTEFYKAYLNSKNADSLISGRPIFTKSAKALLDSNHAVCAKKAGTDICGYDADGDIFLNTQEVGPKLNFKTSSFKAKSISDSVVEVSFSVWPGQGKNYNRNLRLFLKKEGGQWLIDNIITPNEKNVFEDKNSMRCQIQKEIKYYSENESKK